MISESGCWTEGRDGGLTRGLGASGRLMHAPEPGPRRESRENATLNRAAVRNTRANLTGSGLESIRASATKERRLFRSRGGRLHQTCVGTLLKRSRAEHPSTTFTGGTEGGGGQERERGARTNAKKRWSGRPPLTQTTNQWSPAPAADIGRHLATASFPRIPEKDQKKKKNNSGRRGWASLLISFSMPSDAARRRPECPVAQRSSSPALVAAAAAAIAARLLAAVGGSWDPCLSAKFTAAASTKKSNRISCSDGDVALLSLSRCCNASRRPHPRRRAQRPRQRWPRHDFYQSLLASCCCPPLPRRR